MDQPATEDLVEHLVRASPLSPSVSTRIVAEVVQYFSETAGEFVRRRHRELQGSGFSNVEIFQRIRSELPERRFSAPPLTERQLRRMVYG